MADGATLVDTAPASAGGEGGAPAGGTSGGSAPSGGGAPSTPGGEAGAGGSTTPPASGTPAPAGTTGGTAAGAAGTLAGGATGEVPAGTEPTWPDDWRAKLAGDDKAFLKTLDRFTDPGALAKSYRELQAKVSSGVKTAPPPENATPEQMSAWRKDQGLPETPEAYVSDLKLPTGVVFGEADQPILSKFAQTAHEHNIPPAQFAALVSQYAAIQDQQAAQMRENDEQSKQATLIELGKEWGGEAKGNLAAVSSLFDEAPDGIKDSVLTARMPDGTLLGNNPKALKWLSGLAREINPQSSFVGATGDGAKGGEARIKEIEGYMRSSDSQTLYWKNPEVQAEYRTLVDLREKSKARGR